MATIKRFEDLEIWKAAKSFAVAIYMATDKGPFAKDFGLRDQIRRASVSIMANIAEGFDRRSKKDFLKFLAYSLSSASETKSHLYLAADLNYLTSKDSEELILTASAISQRITKFMQYLRRDLESQTSKSLNEKSP